MTKHKYKHLFFDLDHTLWDFDTNSQVVLREIYAEFDLGRYGIPSYEAFHTAYLPVNGQYWARYHHGLLTKDQLRVGRFVETLRRFQVFDIPLATAIARHYTERSPFQTALFPEAIETLEYLRTQYDMHIITNGFEEIQGVKIRQSRLEDYFRHIFISEKIGHQKPEKEIFLHAMQASGASAENSLMIGDNMQTDIAGAQSVGMDQVFFNPQGLKTRDKATYEIRELKELRNIL
jgi:putative hydrolase of the HAD superfamily